MRTGELFKVICERFGRIIEEPIYKLNSFEQNIGVKFSDLGIWSAIRIEGKYVGVVAEVSFFDDLLGESDS